MFARWPGEDIHAATMARGVASHSVPQPMFSPIS
jgi:hypothetical protein